jgi:MFS transporter, PAT family, beta-lactamase induction signal transducer AmpG
MIAHRRPFGEVYFSRRMAVLVGLGFASGLPNVVANNTIGAWLSDLGVNVKAIGLFGLIAFPYIFKFLWAPLLDRYAPPGLGRRRGWLLITQALLTLTLLAMPAVGPESAQGPLTMLAVLGVMLVFFSASQDIVADAYRTDVLSKPELGAGAAVFVAGYRAAYVLAGALALELAKPFGWRIAITSMGMLMGLSMLVTLFAKEPDETARPQSLQEAIVEPWAQLLQSWRARIIILIAFVLLFRLPDQLATPMTSPLLFQHLGFDSTEVGRIRTALGFIITILGALTGGAIIARFGLLRPLIVFGLLQALSNAGFLLLASQPKSLYLMAAIIGVENFCNGMVGAGFVAFLMSCCDHRYSASQYALLSGLMALMALAASAVSGYLVERLGYVGFFAFSVVAGVPGLALIAMLPRPKALHL